MEDMIKMLAIAPPEQRMSMMKDRLTMIAGQPEPQRIESVKGLVLAISKLDDKKKAEFLAGRTNVIIQLSPEQVNAILVARIKVSTQIPENVNKDDIKYSQMAVKQWPEEKQKMWIGYAKKAYEAAGVPMPDKPGFLKE